MTPMGIATGGAGQPMVPPRDRIRICFAHPAYQVAARFAAREGDIACAEVRTFEALMAELPGSDVLVISQMWRNQLAEIAAPLRFIQSISAGHDQFDLELLRARSIRLATAAGVTSQAVAEHAMALILAQYRHLHTARDNQARKHWRGMISHVPSREDQLGSRTLVVIGLGRIGVRLARMAKAFDMHVVGVRQDATRQADGVDAVFSFERLLQVLPSADVVAVTCPLTEATRGLIGAEALASMKPSARLINVARGPIVDEDALIRALQAGRLAGAGLDVTREEPLPAESALWAMPNVLITPHKAGETQRLEDGVIDILMENLGRLWRGEPALRNQVV